MILRLTTYSSRAISKVRRLVKRGDPNMRCTYRHGTLYTRRYASPVQPRSDCQQRNWSLFAEANRRVTADFADPKKKALWLRKAKEQTRYKTARGLARAYYINILKTNLSRVSQPLSSALRRAVISLRPSSALLPSDALYVVRNPSLTWRSHLYRCHVSSLISQIPPP